MEHQDETELVHQASQGSTEAFERLYEYYHNHVYRFLLHLTQDTERTQDLFQETWLRAARYLRTGKKVNHFKTWLFTIAVNLFRDEVRKRRVTRFLLGSFSLPEENKGDPKAPMAHITVTDHGKTFDIRQALSIAMDKLTERQKTVFVLTYVEGFKIHQVSDMLNIAQGTIKSLMFRTVHKLRKELEGLQYND
ncbi:RNA polymerase sigma factor [candidate division KSB1 bacterium]|nr:RNA polymerase sigma factor [candidate division KSB1 bacterium]